LLKYNYHKRSYKLNSLPDDFNQAILKLVNSALSQNTKSVAMATRRLASKAKSVDPTLSESLSSMLANDSVTRSNKPVSLASPVDADSRQKLLIEDYEISFSESPYFSNETEALFDDFFIEWRSRSKLEAEGLTPARSMILTGPPGCGKTTSAGWVASKLDLPLFTLDLATVMSSYLGKTGSNIKAVLDYARNTNCVLLLDEFDSIAKRRDDDSELGELKRLVNVLLQAIESWPSSSVLIAATNHGELLDPTVWRRFDLVIEFPDPTTSQISSLLNSQIDDYCLSSWLSSRISPSSMADLKNNLFKTKKKALLNDRDYIETLLNEFEIDLDSKSALMRAREEAVSDLVERGFSQRKISDSTGLSRPLVKSLIDQHSTAKEQ